MWAGPWPGRGSRASRRDLTQEQSAQYWASVEVPYKPFYAFEETLATFGDDPGSPTSLLASFERITRAVTGGEVSAMPPMADEVRLQYREAFRRQPLAAAGLPQLRTRGPHVGGLGRGGADPGRLQRRAAQHGRRGRGIDDPQGSRNTSSRPRRGRWPSCRRPTCTPRPPGPCGRSCRRLMPRARTAG